MAAFNFRKDALRFCLLCTVCMASRQSAYFTNFSTIDNMWQVDTTCFDCSAKNPDECTKNVADALHPHSISENAGLTIMTTRQPNLSACSPTAGGSSGHLTFKPSLSFGTIRVKAKYFPESEDQVKTAKGFIGMQDSSSGAVTITIHGKGATASGAPRTTDWTRAIQSSCYQHGGHHNKDFSKLDASVNLANEFNWFEVTWTSSLVTIKVNGKTVRTITGSSNIPQKPLHVRLHARSIGYSEMPTGSTFTAYIQEFHYQPLSQRKKPEWNTHPETIAHVIG